MLRITIVAIFCRTSSEIQSAVAKWNRTSAFVFTASETKKYMTIPRRTTDPIQRLQVQILIQ